MQNHTWIKPHRMRLVATSSRSAQAEVDDEIDRPYQSTWYMLEANPASGVKVEPGDDVKVVLSRCAVDYSLLGFVDIREKANALLASQPHLSDLTYRQLQVAGDTSADDMDSDDMDSDDMDSDDMDSDDMDSDDMDSDDMDSDDMDSDDMDSDDMDSDDMDSDGTPDVEQYKDVYGSAQRRALRAASITPGVADEIIVMTVREGSGNLYFRVRGHQGAFARARKFKITVRVTKSDVCEKAQLKPSTSPPPQMSGRKTLILTNTSRPSLELRTNEERRQFLDKLRKLEGPTGGYVYDLAENRDLMRMYALWDESPRCVPQANAVVHSIRLFIEQFVANKNDLEYVVLAGADDVIPFLRVPDHAEISRESQWAGPYQARTPLDASLAQGYFLTDDAYATDRPVDRLGRTVYAPTRAVGRLVEQADDIAKHVAWYLGAKGTTALDRAFVSGYDFVSDLASELTKVLAPAVGGPGNVDTLVSDTWSSDDLRGRLFGGPQPPHGKWKQHNLIAAQGHYSANTLVPANRGPRFRSKELAAVTNKDFAGAIWATIGCHSGHDIVNPQATQYAQAASFAETLLALGATVVGGTGYQYGESVLLKNSERLYVLFAEELTLKQDTAGARYAGGVPIGRALAHAKARYRDELLIPRGIDEKVVGVATLYGLPMLSVKAKSPKDRAPRKADVNVEETRSAGLRAARVAVARDPRLVSVGEHRYYDAGEGTIATPLRPILPATYTEITVPEHTAVSAVWLEGHYYYPDPLDPTMARPVTERSPRMPHYRNRAFLPSRPFRITSFESGRQSLLFAPMQFRSGERVGETRLWREAKFKVYYSSRADITALRDAPLITRPRLDAGGAGVRVSIDIRHYSSSAEVVEAFATYDDGAGRLDSVALTGGVSWGDGNGYVRRFRGELPVPPGRARVFFQAVGDNGRVGTLRNGGQNFAVASTGTPAASTLALTVAPGAAGYRDKIDVEARWTGPGTAAGREVLFRLGASRLWTKTDGAGVAKATLTVAVVPRSEPYLIVATFPGDADAAPSADSKELGVSTAATDLVVGPKPLSGRAREEVCQLILRSNRHGLGERPVTVKRGADVYLIYTDPDGKVRLEPEDVGGPAAGTHSVTVQFAGNDRYEPSEKTFDIKVV